MLVFFVVLLFWVIVDFKSFFFINKIIEIRYVGVFFNAIINEFILKCICMMCRLRFFY